MFILLCNETHKHPQVKHNSNLAWNASKTYLRCSCVHIHSSFLTNYILITHSTLLECITFLQIVCICSRSFFISEIILCLNYLSKVRRKPCTIFLMTYWHFSAGVFCFVNSYRDFLSVFNACSVIILLIYNYRQ